jgi:hypothetical protein
MADVAAVSRSLLARRPVAEGVWHRDSRDRMPAAAARIANRGA